jgi:outer membrane protein TolC
MRFSFLVIFSLLSHGIYAQDSIFSAKDAVNLALQQNLEIQIAQSDLEIASINNNWGNAGKWPLITASVNNTEALSNINQKLANGSSIERNNVSNNNFSTNVAISWRIFNGLRVRSTKERFESIEKMGNIALQQQIDQVVFDVLNIYNNVYYLF